MQLCTWLHAGLATAVIKKMNVTFYKCFIGSYVAMYAHELLFQTSESLAIAIRIYTIT